MTADRAPRAPARPLRVGLLLPFLAGAHVVSRLVGLPGNTWLVAGVVAAVVCRAVGLRLAARLLHGRPVPFLRLTRPAWVLVLVGGALYVVSRTTGSGWLVVLLAGVAATLVVGATLPLVALSGVRVAVRAPSDGTVGRPLHVELTVTGRARDLRLRLPGLEAPEVAVDAPATGVLEAVPGRRGVERHLAVDVATAGPLGLATARRRWVLPLDRPLQVGPRPTPTEVVVPPVAGGAEEGPGCGGTSAELVRSARDYVVGDPLRLVHWPATARAGTLMVRELEAPARAPLALVVDLRGPGDDAEAVASRAAGLALAALRAGVPVTMLTAEPDGAVVGPVADAVQVGRRLARAVAGAPPRPAPGLDASVLEVAAP